MTFTDAACEVLRQSGRPLHYKEITEIAIEQNLLSHVGKSPEVTMGARLAATLKKGGDENLLIRVKPGVFALRDWDEETIKKGLEIKRAPSDRPPGPDAVGGNGNGDNGQAADAIALVDRSASDVDVADVPQAPDEALRAEIAASATDVFAEEDDDDQPILRPQQQPQPQQSQQSQQPQQGTSDDEEGGEGRRRRRRRRRRGSRETGERSNGERANGESLPTYSTTPAFHEEGGSPRGPQVIEVTPSETPSLDAVAGRDLADGVAAILATFDRTVGAVSLRQISETAQRRGKLAGELQLAQSQIAAAVRADNARRTAAGLRPRFRMAGGRVGLTDWLLDGELTRLERDALAALSRYREAARRAFARKCAELPGHAFVELGLLVLERLGVSDIQQVKFPGASGAEAHLVGTLYIPGGRVPGPVGAGAGTRVAVVIRKDGRDVGRERVTELRGSVHHYGGAQAGWILTAGQILSGAREEAGVSGSIPITLLDGPALASLCEDHGVAVVRAEHPVSIPDVDLFEALRST